MAGTYTDDYSVGNRTAAPNLITVTSALAVTGTLSNLVNGAIATGLNFVAGQTAQILTFDFGAVNAANVIITEVKWYQSTTATHGTWQFEGSNDGSSYTPIGATFTLGGATIQTITTMAGNTTAYRYYRFRQTGGTTSSAPALQEAEFQIERLTFPATDLRESGLEVEYMSDVPSDLRVSGVEAEYMWRNVTADIYTTGLEIEVMVSARQKPGYLQIIRHHGRPLASPANVTQAPAYAVMRPAAGANLTQAPAYAIAKPDPEAQVTQVPAYAIIKL